MATRAEPARAEPAPEPGGTALAPVSAALQPSISPFVPAQSVRCPTCANVVPDTLAACPTCGQRLRERARAIRCRRCGKTAPSLLLICPHCGRDLEPAPARLLTIGAPLLLALALLGLIALQAENNNPLRWMADRTRDGVAWVAALSTQLDPQVEVRPPAASGMVASSAVQNLEQLPAQGDAAAAPVAADAAQGSAGGGGGNLEGDAAAGSGGPGDAADAALGYALPITGTEPEAAEPVPTFTPTPALPAEGETGAAAGAAEGSTPSPAPSPTPLPTLPPTETPTLTPAPTDTPGALEYTVQEGDTALGIATRFGVALDQLIAANGMTPDQATLLQPGQRLRIPAQSAGTAAATGSLYTVQSGDTLLGISSALGVPMDVLMQANGLTLASATNLRPGETLLVPGPTQAATPTPTEVPTATPAPAGSLGMRLPAPQLRGPVDGAAIPCSAGGRLQWEPTAGIQPGDQYRVHLGYVGGRDAADNPRVTWLIQQDVPATMTQVGLDVSLCPHAPAEFGSLWRWYIEVVATGESGVPVPVSPPSAVWGFAWN